jgi:site-specific recombinase XerD
MQWAMRTGLANKNPFALVKPPRRTKVEMRVLEVSQACRFLAACAAESSGGSKHAGHGPVDRLAESWRCGHG